MQASAPGSLKLSASLLEAAPHRDFKSLLTQQLRVVLEQRPVRYAVVGIMLIISSALALVPTPIGVDYGWMFIVPVAICAVAAGLAEGLVVAFIASVLCALYVGSVSGFSFGMVLGVMSARFALYGITAGFLGAFAEAHYAVQTSLRRLAETDPLTKVANVASFYEQISILEKERSTFAVILVDVDNLKMLNDTYGHQAGTAAIQLVANVLRRVVRGSDQVARYGGDEFVVLLREADHAGCQIVLNRVAEMLARETLSGVPGYSVKASVGVALSGTDGRTADELLAAADHAMYSDKRSHKREVVLHSSDV